jgi:two-component system response regulator HydG
MQKIHTYPWLGNVRELENMLERSILFTIGKEMTELNLPISIETKNINEWKELKEIAISKAEHAFLDESLKRNNGDIKKVADEMGVTTRAVYGKLRKYNLHLTAYKV